MDGLRLEEYLLTTGKLEWRAFNGKDVVMVKPSRVELVRALRKKYNLIGQIK